MLRLIMAGLLAVLAACDRNEVQTRAVDRLVWRVQDAEVTSVLGNPELLPAEVEGHELFRERFDDPSLPSWQEVDLEARTISEVAEGACRRLKLFAQRDQLLYGSRSAVISGYQQRPLTVMP